jgi:endonuclease/exonuclease/phosphatase family metal-dependent hydrolase
VECRASYAPRSVPAEGLTELVVASFNIHSGVDGWGRRFDPVSACAKCGADVLVLQESWTADGGEGMAQTVGNELDYEVHEMPSAEGRLSGPHPHPGARWKPPSGRFDGPRVVLPDRTRAASKTVTSTTSPTFPANRRWPHGTGSERGTWSVAVLSRLPVESTEIINLRQLRHDTATRGGLRVDVKTKSGTVAVVGTHMSHFSRGSSLQIWQLRKELARIDVPTVLAGDMNLWGPPLVAQLPGWQRAVKGRTWPAWRPHSQPDHILVRPPLSVVDSEVLAALGSDHRAVRARLAIS